MLESFVSENLTSILILGATVLLYWYSIRRPTGIPPGPFSPVPILGNLLSVEVNPVKQFQAWRSKYGDVFSLYLGQNLTIVINGYDCLKEALLKRGDEFSYRPHMHVLEEITGGMGIIGTSGPVWREQRSFALSTLRDFGLGRNILEGKILEEAGMFLNVMEEQNGQIFDFTRLVKTSVSNIICSIVFGKRFDYDDAKFVRYLDKVDENFKIAGITAAVHFFPVLRHLPGDLFKHKQMMKNINCIENTFIKPAIQNRLDEFDEDNIQDFISAYIKEIKTRESRDEETSINIPNLVKAVGDLFIAGSETTATTLRWAVLFFLRDPEVQEKCFKEIQEVLGVDRPPSMSDRLRMPYVEATVTEIQRRSFIVPIAGFHTVPDTTQFMGYTFPKGVLVFANLASVLMDPKLFKDPEEFKPERFLDSNGKFHKPEELIPFSIGKRNCIGESLAKMELFLFLTSMIQRFKFLQPENEALPSLEAVPGSTFSPQPFNFKAIRR